MKRIFIILFCLISLISKAQVYQEMPQYGYRANRMAFDSTLQIPTTCGVPTLRSNVLKKAAIAFDSCNNKIYKYNPKTLTWSEISGSGGSTDTTSLSNRINSKADTSINLQQVTNNGDTTTNNIIIDTQYGLAELGSYGEDSTASLQLIDTAFGTNTSALITGSSASFSQDSLRMTIVASNNSIQSLTGLKSSALLFDNTRTNSINYLYYMPYTSNSNSIDTLATLRDVRGVNLNGYVPYTGATQDVDLGNNQLDAKAVKINGTAGNGHIDFKHQSADASATGSSTVLFANSNGDFKWKNDTKYYTTLKTQQTADRIYTFQNKSYTLADSSDLAAKVNISDTSTMLSSYLRKVDTAFLSSRINLKVNISDTATMLSKYLRKTDTATLSTRIDAKGYALNLGGTNATINASSTYYLGIPGLTITNSAAIRRVYIPKSGTIVGGQLYVKTTNTTTTENWTISIRLNNSNNTTLATVGNTATDKVFASTSLSIAVVAGDYIEITTTTPAFVTAPGSTYVYGSIFIQ